MGDDPDMISFSSETEDETLIKDTDKNFNFKNTVDIFDDILIDKSTRVLELQDTISNLRDKIDKLTEENNSLTARIGELTHSNFELEMKKYSFENQRLITVEAENRKLKLMVDNLSAKICILNKSNKLYISDAEQYNENLKRNMLEIHALEKDAAVKREEYEKMVHFIKYKQLREIEETQAYIQQLKLCHKNTSSYAKQLLQNSNATLVAVYKMWQQQLSSMAQEVYSVLPYFSAITIPSTTECCMFITNCNIKYGEIENLIRSVCSIQQHMFNLPPAAIYQASKVPSLQLVEIPVSILHKSYLSYMQYSTHLSQVQCMQQAKTPIRAATPYNLPPANFNLLKPGSHVSPESLGVQPSQNYRLLAFKHEPSTEYLQIGNGTEWSKYDDDVVPYPEVFEEVPQEIVDFAGHSIYLENSNTNSTSQQEQTKNDAECLKVDNEYVLHNETNGDTTEGDVVPHSDAVCHSDVVRHSDVVLHSDVTEEVQQGSLHFDSITNLASFSEKEQTRSEGGSKSVGDKSVVDNSTNGESTRDLDDDYINQMLENRRSVRKLYDFIREKIPEPDLNVIIDVVKQLMQTADIHGMKKHVILKMVKDIIAKRTD